MKIDTTKPRIPLDRLKHPVKPTLALPTATTEDKIEKTDQSEFSDAFERAIIKRGAIKFKEWLDQLGIN